MCKRCSVHVKFEELQLRESYFVDNGSFGILVMKLLTLASTFYSIFSMIVFLKTFIVLSGNGRR